MSITRTMSKCCCGAIIETPSTAELREWHILHGVCLAPKPTIVIPNHTEIRRKLWRDVAVAVAGSSNAQNKISTSSWADYVLAEFDKRYREY